MKSLALSALLLVGAISIPAQTVTPASSNPDYNELLKGVQEIGAPGVPGGLVVFGPTAFGVVAGKADKESLEPVVAAAKLGSGRIVAFGHNGYLSVENLKPANTEALFDNSLRWAGRSPNRFLVVVRRNDKLAAHLTSLGFAITNVPLEKLTVGHVLVADAHSLNEKDSEIISRFVRSGGGFITAATGWGWAQGNPKKEFANDFPANAILVPAGMAWTTTTPDKTTATGYAVHPSLPAYLNAGTALDAALAPSAGKAKLSKADLAQASSSLVSASLSVPANDHVFLPRLQSLTRDPKIQSIPAPKRPIKEDNFAGRILVTLQGRELRKQPLDAIKPHPAAEFFPGTVPKDAPRLTAQSVTLDLKVPEWHSTGLYAAPGETITVQLPADAAGKNLHVRIGAHKDVNWHLTSWTRFPEITRTAPLKEANTKLACAFGGPVYIEVPKNLSGQLTVQISGAVAAPYYVLGKTSLADWKDKLRNAPGPWAELETSKVIITVPSSVVRNLDDPEALMKVWDQVLDLDAELATISKDRLRPERIVTDEQISAGYMHSGYPIMTWMDQINNFVSRDNLLKGNWGIFHELGHNHQVSDWTFGGTTEVTCNLFTLYVFDKLCKTQDSHHKALTSAAIIEKHAAYAAGGTKFEKWQNDPFLALAMYVQLRDGFGWEPYQKVFAEYRKLPAEQRPKTDAERRDQWMVRFSRTVNHNLGPFFQAWGIPVSKPALDSIAGLPAWMPPNFPANPK